MAQTRRSSLIEAIINTTVGYVISIATYWFVMPLLGFAVSLNESIVLVAVFSAISIVRNYVIRRIFARKELA